MNGAKNAKSLSIGFHNTGEMKMCRLFTLILIGILFCGSMVQARNITIPFLEHVTADVNEIKNGYSIVLSFPPVTSMGKVANREINFALARKYAGKALSIYLQKDVAISPMYSLCKQGEANEEGDVVTFVVKCAADKLLPVQEVSEKEEEKGVSTNDTVVDLDDFMDDFRSSCFKDVRTAESIFSDMIKTSGDMDSLTKLIDTAFMEFSKKIEIDDELLIQEKQELNNELQKIRGRLGKAIQQKSKENQRKGLEERKIDDALVEEQLREIGENWSWDRKYTPFLLEKLTILSSGGYWTMTAEDGRIFCVAVGHSEVRGTTIGAVNNAWDLAKKNAFLAISSAVSTSMKVNVEDEEITIVEAGVASNVEETREVSTIISSGNVQGFEEVARWRSYEGECYVAIGKILKSAKSGKKKIKEWTNYSQVDCNELCKDFQCDEFKYQLCLEKFPELLLEGGCKAFRLKSGEKILIGVGKVPAETNLKRQQENARGDARKRMTENQRVGIFSVRQNNVDRVTREEEFISLARIGTEGILQRGYVFASWYSQDGSYFYLGMVCEIQ